MSANPMDYLVKHVLLCLTNCVTAHSVSLLLQLRERKPGHLLYRKFG